MAVVVLAVPRIAQPQQTPDRRVADLVRAGKVRVALFAGQYNKDSVTGELKGVWADVARAFAARVGVQLILVEHPTPPRMVECLKAGACDVGFLGYDSTRTADVEGFTPPFIEFDYTYLVPAGSRIHSEADADRLGVRVAVVRAHASTLTLTRMRKHAELVGVDTPDSAFKLLRTGRVDAWASARPVLVDYSARLPGSRVLEGRYGVNRAAVVVAKGAAARLAYLSEFIEDIKASGLVQQAITRSGWRGVRVATPQSTPVGDYHQHLYSPAVSAMISTPTRTVPPVDARDLIAQLDSAGIRNAAVLSLAYMFGAAGRSVENEQVKVRAENDWTAAQAALYPDRLRAFCSVNPIKPYALEEIAYCARQPGLKRGLKLHFGNSDVRTDIPEQLEQLKKVFKAANDAGMAIIVHMHANINNRRPYGVEQGKVFLEQLVPQAPDVTIQIAHLAGAGGADDTPADSVAGVFADAFARNDPRTKNLWFDLTLVADRRLTPALGERAARRIRQIGTSRMLFGSDAVPGTPPSVVLSYFWKLPLTSEEFRAIAQNVPPYMR